VQFARYAGKRDRGSTIPHSLVVRLPASSAGQRYVSRKKWKRGTMKAKEQSGNYIWHDKQMDVPRVDLTPIPDQKEAEAMGLTLAYYRQMCVHCGRAWNALYMKPRGAGRQGPEKVMCLPCWQAELTNKK
jgi:hypothetical protein